MLFAKEQASSEDSRDEDSCVWDENCSIFTGKGRLYVRLDSKVFRFSSSKHVSLFKQRKNPRKIAWTVVCRRVNRKGISEEVAKKRSRKTVKANRGVGGLSIADITARRNQKPEARAAARTAALAQGSKRSRPLRKPRRPTSPSAQPKMSKKNMKAGGKR